MSREIVSFQLGNLSNFVGTHWWNLQEASFVYDTTSCEKAEISHDVTFREGLTLKEEVTYTPRLIAVDLSDALHCLKIDGTLYDVEPEGDNISWSHEVTIHKEEVKHRKNEFLKDMDALDNPDKGDMDEVLDESSSKEEMETEQIESEVPVKGAESKSVEEKVYHLDDSVHSWCDYLRLHLHPRSLSVVKGYYQSDDSFNIHGYGTTLYNNQSVDLRSELEDKIHFFTEEADHLQGFHMLADVYDGFGGLASSLAADLSDEFTKRGCICFCPFQSQRSSQDNSHSLRDLINTVLTTVRLSNAGFSVVPLSLVDNPWKSAHQQHTLLPGITYKRHLPYHTSAIFAAALDTATLSHRLLQGSLPLYHLTDSLSSSGRMVSNLSLAFPLPLESQLSEMSIFTKASDPMLSLTPLYDVNSSQTPSLQSIVLRGAQACTGSLLEETVSKWYPSTANSVMEVRKPCKVRSPYPHIFDNKLDESGYRTEKLRPKHKAVESVAAMTSLSSTNQSEVMLTHLLERSEKLSRRHLHKHLEAGLELDDWNENVNELRDLTKRYSSEECTTGSMDMSDSD